MSDFDTFDLTRFEAGAESAARLLRALSNERRLLALCLLAGGERAVGELQQKLGVSQSALSQHLAVLREEGLVATRRDGQSVFYRVADPAALRVIQTLAEIYCPSE